jgi:hypothetical protein
MTMQKHYDAIANELRAAIETAGDDMAGLLDMLERVNLDVRSARFAAGFALFGKQFKAAREAEPTIDADEPPPRRFEPGTRVRTPDNYLAHVGYYDSKGRVVANVVFQACEFKEDELTAVME